MWPHQWILCCKWRAFQKRSITSNTTANGGPRKYFTTVMHAGLPPSGPSECHFLYKNDISMTFRQTKTDGQALNSLLFECYFYLAQKVKYI